MQAKRKEMRQAGSAKPWGIQSTLTLHLISLFLKQMGLTFSLYSRTFSSLHTEERK